MRERPTSPHIGIYKTQMNSVLSFGHRLSGICLFFLLITCYWWFVFWVFYEFDSCFLELLDNNLTKILLIASSYGIFYHLATGIRHLFWDIGFGYSLCSINITNWLIVSLSILSATCFIIKVIL